MFMLLLLSLNVFLYVVGNLLKIKFKLVFEICKIGNKV